EANRKSIRLFGSFVPSDEPPAVFGKFVQPSSRGVVSSVSLLMDTAREVGKLDELAAELQKLADEEIENAPVVLALVQLARGQGDKVEKQLKQHLAELSKKRQPGNDQYDRSVKPVEWTDYLVMRACLADAKLNSLGEEMARELLQHAQQTQNNSFIAH